MVGANWTGKTVAELYEFISTQMPADAPGSRTPSEYLTAMIYILSRNGFTAGTTPMPSDPAAMATMILQRP
jgi:alcohol dehydrogenase (cytochrome c)